MNWNNLTVLVTGGAGAIGCNLVRELLKADARVVVLDDLSSGRVENLPDDPVLEFTLGSVTDPEALQEVFRRDYAVVFHLAALFANQNSVEHPEADLIANGLGTLKVLEWSRRAGVGRFLFASSSCVYGAKEGVLHEESSRGPHQTPYAMTKALGEDYVSFFYRYHGLPTVILRYFNSYGPGEYPGRYRNVIPNFIARAMAGESLVITGSGDETRDFTYVGDTVQATLAAAQAPDAVGHAINVGTGKEVTIRELAERINGLVGNSGGIVYAPQRKWDHVRRRVASVEKAQRLLGYTPTVDLEEGLELTWRWLQEHASEAVQMLQGQGEQP